MDRVAIKEKAKQQFAAQKNPARLIALAVYILSFACSIPYIGQALALFVLLNVTLGASISYLKIWRGEETQVGDIFSIGFSDYGRYLGGQILVNLFVFLWSLLFVIPGIIMGLAYALTPYILNEMTDISTMDAIRLSKRMMQGHKGELFVFGLSFLGWNILNSFTLGILGILYVWPYQNTAMAGFYENVKNDAIAKGIITPIPEAGIQG